MLFWKCDLFQSTRILSSNIHSHTASNPHLKQRVFQQRRDVNNAFVRCGLFSPLSSKELHRQLKLWMGGERSVSNGLVFKKAKFKEWILHLPQTYQVLQGPSVPSHLPPLPKDLRISSQTWRITIPPELHGSACFTTVNPAWIARPVLQKLQTTLLYQICFYWCFKTQKLKRKLTREFCTLLGAGLQFCRQKTEMCQGECQSLIPQERSFVFGIFICTEHPLPTSYFGSVSSLVRACSSPDSSARTFK